MPGHFSLDHSCFPETIAVFPLDSVLLLPGGQLPLNIFEARYIQMVDDALATPHRMIGMIMLREEEASSRKLKHIYSIGCAGRITSYSETPDGRYLVTLTGISRFAVKDEIATTCRYRRVIPNWQPYLTDLQVDANIKIDRGKLLKQLQTFCRVRDLSFDSSGLEQIPNFNLVTFFAMHLPFTTAERQALLEAKDVATRAEVLMTLLELGQRSKVNLSSSKH